jgi:hypothetical protein
MIGWYVHHHGGGHLRRFGSIASELRVPVTVLSSMDPPNGNEFAWVRLADDALPSSDLRDVDAHDTLHWAPRHHPGLAARTAQVAKWIHEERPSLIVVDVSVEVSLLSRLAGVPVVVTAMPGDRRDRAHAMAYELADALIAAWPEHVATGWPRRWVEKTHFVGPISRFAGRTPQSSARRSGSSRNRALLLWGSGGQDRAADFAALEAATPAWDWSLACAQHRLDEEALWSELCAADVVVTHGGQGAVGDVVASGAPAVVVADPRPFDEQLHTVRALAADGVALGLEEWPDPAGWPLLLKQARALRERNWGRWRNGAGAVGAARAIEALAKSEVGRTSGGVSLCR